MLYEVITVLNGDRKGPGNRSGADQPDEPLISQYLLPEQTINDRAAHGEDRYEPKQVVRIHLYARNNFV